MLAGFPKQHEKWMESMEECWLVWWTGFCSQLSKLSCSIGQSSCHTMHLEIIFYGVYVDIGKNHWSQKMSSAFRRSCCAFLASAWIWLDPDKLLMIFTPQKLILSTISTSTPLMWSGVCSPPCFLKFITSSFASIEGEKVFLILSRSCTPSHHCLIWNSLLWCSLKICKWC